MCGRRYRQWGKRGGRAFFPESTPPPLNYAVVTSKLLSEPRPGRGPSGDPVTFLEVEFPVDHPEYPRFLWTYANYDVEVPGEVGGRDLDALREGTSILISGQLSERLVDEDGRTGRHPAIVASLVSPGPPAEGRAVPGCGA